MAWAYVQSGGDDASDAGGSATAQVTAVTDTTSGNLLVVAVTGDASGMGTLKVTDNKGNEYAPAGFTLYPTTGSGVALYIANNIVGGATHTITATCIPAGSIGIAFIEFTGSEEYGIRAYEVDYAEETPATPAVAAAAGDLLIGAVCRENDSSPTTLTAGSGFTMTYTSAPTANRVGIGLEYLVPAAGSTVVDWTVSVGGSLHHSLAIALYELDGEGSVAGVDSTYAMTGGVME